METEYGVVAFPKGEERCLSRGQQLTDRMIDYLAVRILKSLDPDYHYHYLPTWSSLVGPIPWHTFQNQPYQKILTILNHQHHWFLLVYEPARNLFHLFDPLPTEEESVVDFCSLPIREEDTVEDYYGSIPNQGPSKTNCGVFVLLYLMCMVSCKPMDFPSDNKYINQHVRPQLKRALHEEGFDFTTLFA